MGDNSRTYPSYLQQFDEAAALKFLKDPKTSKEVRNLAFAYFTPDEFPTHRMLQELMMLDPMGAERDQIMEIATLILPWCRDGNYGCLFDGTSNLSLTGKIAHFELGYIPESAKELKAAAGFLITNHARKHIMTLPRALRKRNVYEEVARFLDIPGGQEIVQETYAQLRKFNCWNISIVQQYARFKQSRIRSAVFGNSRQFFIMRQNDRADLDDMGKDIALPEVTQHAIMNYPLPDHQTGQKYSPFTYLHTDSTRNICGTVHNVASPEMLYCSSVQRRTLRPPRPRASPESERRRRNHPSRQPPQRRRNQNPLTRYENQTHHQRIQTASRSPSSPACSPVAPPRAPSATWRSARAGHISAMNSPTAIRLSPPPARRAESS